MLFITFSRHPLSSDERGCGCSAPLVSRSSISLCKSYCTQQLKFVFCTRYESQVMQQLNMWSQDHVNVFFSQFLGQDWAVAQALKHFITRMLGGRNSLMVEQSELKVQDVTIILPQLQNLTDFFQPSKFLSQRKKKKNTFPTMWPSGQTLLLGRFCEFELR